MPYIFPREHILDDIFKIVQDFVEFIAVRNAQEEDMQETQKTFRQGPDFSKSQQALGQSASVVEMPLDF